jgi:predicted RNase H-like nuclease
MSWLAGVDGCRAGWFRVSRDLISGELRFDLTATIEAVLEQTPEPSVVALDMPIGLPDVGPRECDTAARACIGSRRSSVFPAPIRSARDAKSRGEADAITRSKSGKGVSAQAYGIYAKVRAVDDLLASNAVARTTLFEVHPEVSFWAWNDRTPMRFGKKLAAGLREREALAEHWLGRGVIASARGDHLKKDLADDDILDAIALLWTAHRIAEGKHATLPESPPTDATGLPMRIVF